MRSNKFIKSKYFAKFIKFQFQFFFSFYEIKLKEAFNKDRLEWERITTASD